MNRYVQVCPLETVCSTRELDPTVGPGKEGAIRRHPLQSLQELFCTTPSVHITSSFSHDSFPPCQVSINFSDLGFLPNMWELIPPTHIGHRLLRLLSGSDSCPFQEHSTSQSNSRGHGQFEREEKCNSTRCQKVGAVIFNEEHK